MPTVEKIKSKNKKEETKAGLTGDWIEVWGAREHNLKNIDLAIPREKLVVITGVSGSGKSSFAFDTLYAEGQRRYLETFSAYARQFIGELKSPEVDKISGLSPVIAIEQKTTSRNPRSTVGTVTEIYDLFRLFYARAAEAFSHINGKQLVKMSDEEIVESIQNIYRNKKIVILAPVVRSRKGHYRELFQQYIKQGYTKVRVDGEFKEMKSGMTLDRYKIHDIELVVDRIEIGKDFQRLAKSVSLAMTMGEGAILIQEHEQNELRWFSRNLMDPESGLSYDEPSPNSFSFNSPYGACPVCAGLGYVYGIDEKSIVPDPSLSINRGAIAPIGELRDIWIFEQLRKVSEAYGFSLANPWSEVPDEAKTLILEGKQEGVSYPGNLKFKFRFDGVKLFLQEHFANSTSDKIKDWAEQFMQITTCPDCKGDRLKIESLHFRIADKNISDLTKMDIGTLENWVKGLNKKLNPRQKVIGTEVMREIAKRLSFLTDVGLEYLSLDRPAKSLSGGEAQRIRLATQIGSQLTGVLYILDEPSIGLHQRDNHRLIDSLLKLRDLGNTVLVVEHDKEMMLASDYLVDFGPGAGSHGGEVVAQGTPNQFLSSKSSTADYLNGKKKISAPAERRSKGNESLSLLGASGNNLKKVNLKLPLGRLICITGVSGSGKSSLINETLFPILSTHFYRSKPKPLPYDAIQGLDKIDKVVEIDQSPIGRSPRSNPVTYTGVFSSIRDLFTQLPEAKIRGYKPGRFSFNVKGGRCEACEGAGMKTIEMNFLPDVYVPCDGCQGRRYNRETLEVRYKGKSINDVLNMTVEDASKFFEAQPSILNKIKTLAEVGLGYITLGQQATTLSGGEAQRVKIATELSKRDTGNTLYLLDEPTTGLHFQDIEMLLSVLNRLVDKGNTVVVIEHNLDVIKVADWVIDLGPEGGAAGGYIVAEGTPEQIAKSKKSITGQYLAKEL